MTTSDLQAGNDNPPRDHAARPCPICKRPSMADFSPFCSDRCQKVDLNRWLNGSYVVPGTEPAPEDSIENPED